MHVARFFQLSHQTDQARIDACKVLNYTSQHNKTPTTNIYLLGTVRGQTLGLASTSAAALMMTSDVHVRSSFCEETV